MISNNDLADLLFNEDKLSQYIVSFLISKYGKEILATPQKKGSDLFLWIIPIIVLVFGVITYWSLYKTIRLKIKREHN